MYYTQLRTVPAPRDTKLTWDKTSWEDFFDPDWEDEEPPIDAELDDIANGGK
jgi:hypothetical protein